MIADRVRTWLKPALQPLLARRENVRLDRVRSRPCDVSALGQTPKYRGDICAASTAGTPTLPTCYCKCRWHA